MGLEELSREELLELLRKKDEPSQSSSTKEISVKICKFKPARGKPCDQEATTKYGYCKKHSTTLQARREREAMEFESEVSTPTQPPSEPSVPEPSREPEQVVESRPEKLLTPRDVEEYDHEYVKPPPPRRRRKKIIKPNRWHRYEDPETRIVFDPSTKKAYGVQDYDTGRVLSLTARHINLCKKYGWQYQRAVIRDPYEDLDSESEESEPDSDSEEVSDSESEERYDPSQKWADDEVSDSY